MNPVKYIGFDDATGYGIAAKSMVAALRQVGATVHWVPVTGGRSAWKPSTVCQATEGYASVILHLVPEYYPCWIEFERSLGREPKQIWGHTTWETNALPGHWKELLNLPDGIFVPCTWNREVFRRCGVTSRIELLPHVSQFQGGEPEEAPSPVLQTLASRVRGRFVFYMVGVWSERKAQRELIGAFLGEFGPDEPVVLVIKTGRFDCEKRKRTWSRPWKYEQVAAAESFRKAVSAGPKGPEIIHIDQEISGSDMAWLHQLGGCFVSLSRGEGWGMGSYEAAWWGKPVITTGYGGVLDYLPGHLSYHVKHRLVPVRTARGCKSYTDDQRWAEADATHAGRLMRGVFEDQQGAVEKGRGLGEYVRQYFSATRMARRCLQAVS